VSTPHPERLPWFAAGALDRTQAAEIERHLQGCAECRDEVAALRSMTRSLRVVPKEHIAADRLVAYHAASGDLTAEECARIESHLGGCPACRSDLTTLKQADASLLTPNRRRMLGAAASFFLVALAGWQVASLGPDKPLATNEPEVVELTSGQRGPAPMVPAGPCTLRLWLPGLASGSSFVARVEDRTIGTFVANGGAVELPVPEGLAPGHHVITLTAAEGEGLEPYPYPFDVQDSP
jgi:anti-sigma factor RsiW